MFSSWSHKRKSEMQSLGRIWSAINVPERDKVNYVKDREQSLLDSQQAHRGLSAMEVQDQMSQLQAELGRSFLQSHQITIQPNWHLDLGLLKLSEENIDNLDLLTYRATGSEISVFWTSELWSFVIQQEKMITVLQLLLVTELHERSNLWG